jgi:hypothetical protein
MDSRRRALLQAAVAVPAAASLPSTAQSADVDLTLTAAPGEAQILDGPATASVSWCASKHTPACFCTTATTSSTRTWG